MRSCTTWLALLATGVAAMLPARPAAAQSTQDKAAAEALFDEAKKLLLDKKFAEACPRFERSLKLDPGIGTRLYLADCYESSGRFASAWAMFREAAAAARAAGQGDREGVARKRAADLEPRLFRLTINVASPAPGEKITRNDGEERPETWNVALPVDAGKYTITASAPGKKTWTGAVEIPAGPGEKSLSIPALEDEPAAHAVEPPKGPPAGGPPPETGLGTQRIAGIATGAAGVLLLGVSGALTGVAGAKNATAKSLCPNPACANADGVSAGQTAGKLADAATGTVIAGAALAGAGLVVFLTAPKRPASAWIAPAVGPGMAGIFAGRTW